MYSVFSVVSVRIKSILLNYQAISVRYATILLLIILAAFSTACGRQNHDKDLIVFNGLTMGTSYTIKLGSAAAGTDRESIRRGIEKALHDVNQRMSTYLDNSELSIINKTETTDKIPVSDELSNLLATAMQISWYTNGAFDITVGPLVNLWGFGPVKKKPVIPSREIIERTRAKTGYAKIKLGLDPDYIQKSQPDLYLDLSGIAKGYGVDQVAAYLDTLAIKNYMIEVGGEVKAKGAKADGTSWRIGIEKPVSDQRRVERIIQLDNMGMATSGDYRNYFEIDGKRYSHIIDPATGYPVSHNLVSVSVMDEYTTRADALATALIVMGPDKGVKFANDNKIAAMFIIRNGNGFTEKYTGPFEHYLINE